MTDHTETFAMLLGEVSRLWRRSLDERLKPLGLSQAKWRALLHLSFGDGISQRELSERIGIEGPTLVGLLDRLAKDGYIQRRESADDRRCKTVHLSAKAHATLSEIKRVNNQLRRELLGDVPPKQLHTAIDTLQHVKDRIVG